MGRSKKWPCGTFRKDTHNTQSLLCESCDKWFHSGCEKIGKSKFELFTQNPEAYICQLCRTDNGIFDFLHGIARLKMASEQGFQKLKRVVDRERLFFTHNRLCIQPNIAQKLHVDVVSNTIATKHTTEPSFKPAKTSADGDCLFNAVSISLLGNEHLSTQLRYRTCLEMITNREAVLSHPQRSSFSLLSPDYEDACMSCAGDGNSYSSMWTLIALTNIIQIPIKSVYPFVNGIKDFAAVKFNTMVQPCQLKSKPDPSSTKEPLKVMWTSLQPPVTGRMWIPNHFVPLVPTSVTSYDPQPTNKPTVTIQSNKPDVITIAIPEQSPEPFQPGKHKHSSKPEPFQPPEDKIEASTPESPQLLKLGKRKHQASKPSGNNETSTPELSPEPFHRGIFHMTSTPNQSLDNPNPSKRHKEAFDRPGKKKKVSSPVSVHFDSSNKYELLSSMSCDSSGDSFESSNRFGPLSSLSCDSSSGDQVNYDSEPNRTYCLPSKHQIVSDSSLSDHFENRNELEISGETLSSDTSNNKNENMLKKAPIPGKFMSGEMIFDVLKGSTDLHVSENIPLGDKNDVYIGNLDRYT